MESDGSSDTELFFLHLNLFIIFSTLAPSPFVITSSRRETQFKKGGVKNIIITILLDMEC